MSDKDIQYVCSPSMVPTKPLFILNIHQCSHRFPWERLTLGTNKPVVVFPTDFDVVIEVYFYIPWGIEVVMFLRNISLNRDVYYFLSSPRASLDPRAGARGLGLGLQLSGNNDIVRSCFISFWRCDVMTFNGFHAKALRARLRRAFVRSYWFSFIYHDRTVDEMIHQNDWVLLPEKVDYSYSVRAL